ncbi:unnamed protein product [Cuscuta europaea]|uniref:DNA mismatch repair proteins mutS family domain-containing protein n=1 Tax=Cuscuta europaea TaxID=41803 RepID=A0A9P0YPR6_CUSEU|nr:unnamed protein product [Cuscuta europaea]
MLLKTSNAMSWLTVKNVVISVSGWRYLLHFLRPPLHRYCCSVSSPHFPITWRCDQIHCFNRKKLYATSAITNRHLESVPEEKNYAHIMWWKETVERSRKPSSIKLVKRLTYSNLLGVNSDLRNGSLKEGTLNWEMLQFKSRFPREVLLCRVGEFYEAVGFDACILVEYAGLNPCGGLRSDGIPKAGCPVMNLRQTLDDLTSNGFSVCIIEEVQGPTQARSRKSRFISGHAHPGNPYVFGLVGDDHDLDFPEPMPVVGISHSAKGYCITSVLETTKTYSTEDGLTEEALVTKLRTTLCHHLFLHTSLKNNSSGTSRWGEFGNGGLLWGECNARNYEWLDGDLTNELLSKVKEIYGLDLNATFRNATVVSENRPRPLHLGTATQIGAIPTEGIPSLLKVLLPAHCTGLPVLYIRNLLLNPPAYEIASKIQQACRLMMSVTCSLPEFTCVSSSKLAKLLELREANHVEFCRIKTMLDEILQMNRHNELAQILHLLIDPTWEATGLKVDFDLLVNECKNVSSTIGELIFLDGESDQKTSSSSIIPKDFFEDVESLWKGRVKRVHLEDAYAEVERAANALSLVVTEDFLPIISRVKAMNAPLGGPKGEILYARDHQAVWFKGKRFIPSVWAGTPGEDQIKRLKPAVDSKGKKVGDEWFTTMNVEKALARYHEANAKAKLEVLELLRGLSSVLQTKINIIVFASMLVIIAKALFAHVSEGRRRKWIFPSLMQLHGSKDCKPHGGVIMMRISGLSPYWFDVVRGSAVQNSVDMQSLFLLTGPNGGGKSSLLRSICAAALLGICGFMIPAESAVIPHFDSIMLHMKSYDSPADGKSSFQIEMSEIRSLINGCTSRSLVLIDEICRGTETAKGTCIAGSIIETLDEIGCLGIVSTHLHGIFDLHLNTKKTVCKAMGTDYIDGQPVPNWKLVDGICRESLAFETAQREGIPEKIIRRAEQLYQLYYFMQSSSLMNRTSEPNRFTVQPNTSSSDEVADKFNGSKEEFMSSTRKSANIKKIIWKELENTITTICQEKLMELQKMKHPSELAVKCFMISVREQPPPSTIGTSTVYVMLRPDNKLYVGQSDDLGGRIRAHRSNELMEKASFLYFCVPGKSAACELETLLINQLPKHGFQLINVADGRHRNFGTSHHSLEAVPIYRLTNSPH